MEVVVVEFVEFWEWCVEWVLCEVVVIEIVVEVCECFVDC